MTSTKLKLLFIDIETSALNAFTWDIWQQNISGVQIIKDRYILSFSAKWLNDDYIYYGSLPDYPAYKKDKSDDSELVADIRKMLDEADIVVAHNGKKFDIPIINARCLIHGYKPPSTYRVIDTLLVARSMFGFVSNKLDDLGKALKVGRKIDNGGFQLWRDIMLDDKKSAWKAMVEYNCQDVLLLEAVYNKLKPWDKKHPHMIAGKGKPRCTVCTSDDIHANGKYYTNNSVFQRWHCNNCGHNMRTRNKAGDLGNA
jgi:DNA polymerase elongation subunit (family B)